MDFDKIFLRFKKYNYTKICKICDGECLRIFAHTAKCQDCGVLLNFPYVEPREVDFLDKEVSSLKYIEAQELWLDWHVKSGAKNHNNFTAMVNFCDAFIKRESEMEVLD